MQTITREQEAELWRCYSQHNDADARLCLIEYYLPLARKISVQLYGRRPDEIAELADYYHFGVLGLIEAVERYNVESGAVFSTFAQYRIKGAILNGLDQLSEYREQLAFKKRAETERLASLHQNDKKHGEALFKELAELTVELAITCLLEGTGALLESVADDKDPLYDNQLLISISEQLGTMVEQLPKQEKLIIRYHYYYQMSFGDLAALLQISRGRVSQMHKRILQVLRKNLLKQKMLDRRY